MTTWSMFWHINILFYLASPETFRRNIHQNIVHCWVFWVCCLFFFFWKQKRYLDKKKTAEEMEQQYQSSSSVDYSLKDGETLVLHLKNVSSLESHCWLYCSCGFQWEEMGLSKAATFHIQSMKIRLKNLSSDFFPSFVFIPNKRVFPCDEFDKSNLLAIDRKLVTL